MPNIVMSWLTAHAIARMNGATAFFTRPLYVLRGLLEGIQTAIKTHDGWEPSLIELQEELGWGAESVCLLVKRPIRVSVDRVFL